MPLDARAKRFLDTLAALNPPSALCLSAAERRNALKQLLSFSGPVGVGRERRGSTPCRDRPDRSHSACYSPRSDHCRRGASRAHLLSRRRARCREHRNPRPDRPLPSPNASGCRVLFVDYRLGPGTPLPGGRRGWVRGDSLDRRERAAIWASTRSGWGYAATRPVRRWPRWCARSMAARAGAGLAFQFLLCPITDFSDGERLAAQLRAGVPGRPRYPAARSQALSGTGDDPRRPAHLAAARRAICTACRRPYPHGRIRPTA